MTTFDLSNKPLNALTSRRSRLLARYRTDIIAQHGNAQTHMSRRRRRTILLLKWGLPLLATIITVAAFSWSQWENNLPTPEITYVSDRGDTASELGLETARYYGQDANSQPYTITADEVSHRNPTPRTVDLIGLQADITLSSGVWLTFSSEEGIFDRTANILMLDSGVNIFSDLGYEFFTESLLLNFDLGIATSETPIRGQGPFGVITADRLRVSKMGHLLCFHGNVKGAIYPPIARLTNLRIGSPSQ